MTKALESNNHSTFFKQSFTQSVTYSENTNNSIAIYLLILGYTAEMRKNTVSGKGEGLSLQPPDYKYSCLFSNHFTVLPLNSFPLCCSYLIYIKLYQKYLVFYWHIPPICGCCPHNTTHMSPLIQDN